MWAVKWMKLFLNFVILYKIVACEAAVFTIVCTFLTLKTTTLTFHNILGNEIYFCRRIWHMAKIVIWSQYLCIVLECDQILPLPLTRPPEPRWNPRFLRSLACCRRPRPSRVYPALNINMYTTHDLGGGLAAAVARLGVDASEQRAALRGVARRVLQRGYELERVQRHHAVVVVRRQY